MFSVFSDEGRTIPVEPMTAFNPAEGHVLWVECIGPAIFAQDRGITLRLVGDQQRSDTANVAAFEINAKIVSLEFTSDHNLMYQNGKNPMPRDPNYGRTDIRFAGPKYVGPEWNPGAAFPNYPTSHTAGDDPFEDRISAELTVGLETKGLPSNVTLDRWFTFALVGDSVNESALCFTAPDAFSYAELVAGKITLPLTATNPIGAEIRTIDAPIAWTLSILRSEDNPDQGWAEINLGSTGSHVIYTTLGRPVDADVPDAKYSNYTTDPNLLTPLRMEVAQKRVWEAIVATGVDDPSNPRIVHELSKKYSGAFDLDSDRSSGNHTVWDIGVGEKGDCFAISRFVSYVANMVGISCSAATFVPFHVTAPTVLVVPLLAEEGSLRNVTHPDHPTWQLSLVLDGKHNYFQAAVVVPHESSGDIILNC
ncbi:MAG: hypothetical protein AB1696_24550 [Planctomycetota bacterium]